MSRFLKFALILFCIPALSACGSINVHKSFIPNDQADELSDHADYYVGYASTWDEDAGAFVVEERNGKRDEGIVSVLKRGKTYVVRDENKVEESAEINLKYVSGGWWGKPSHYIVQLRAIDKAKKEAKKTQEEKDMRFLFNAYVSSDEITLYYAVMGDLTDRKAVKRLEKLGDGVKTKVSKNGSSSSISFDAKTSENNRREIINVMKSLKPEDHLGKFVLKPVSQKEAERIMLETAKK